MHSRSVPRSLQTLEGRLISKRESIEASKSLVRERVVNQLAALFQSFRIHTVAAHWFGDDSSFEAFHLDRFFRLCRE